MDLTPVPLQPLAHGQLKVMRTRAALLAAALLVAALLAEAVARAKDLPPGMAVGPVLLVALWLVLVSPPRRFRHWGYAFTGDELHVAHGWWTQVHTVVPVTRVQHIDLTQTPLERRHHVSTLTLHTAGTEHSRVSLPGLARTEAEAIRDAIRARSNDAPW